ncbi:hypothetical protein V6C27_05745 [Peptococcaceae bacterium 1198_IL3148]
MKRKNLLIVLLTLALCFSIVFATNATQPTAKDLVLAKVKNFELGYDKGFYDKSEGTTQFNIQKFDGTIKDELGDFAGTKFEMLAQLDSASNSIKINYNTDVKGNKASGDIFLKDDMVIFTKDLLDVLQSFGIDVEPEMLGLTGKVPQYLYVKDQQLSSVWEQMVTYQNQQLPDEYKELLLFLIEAVPDKYFSMSASTVTVQIDQAAFEDVIYNLLTKVQNEKERFTDIFVAMNQYNLTTMGVTAEEMREQIITGIANSQMPSKEEIKMIGAFVDVNMTYQAAIFPGGVKSFDMSIKFNAPDNSVTGVLNVKTESKGKSGNIDGKYNITGNVVVVDGPKVDVQILSDYQYVGTKAESDTVINVKAEDTATGELFCDFSAIGGSTTTVEKDVVIKVPALTTNNSVDLSQYHNVTPVTEIQAIE